MRFQRTQVANMLEADPDLAAEIPRDRLPDVERRANARVVSVGRGPWFPPDAVGDAPDGLGLLALDGLVLRRVELGGRTTVDLIGPGDLIRPYESEYDQVAMLPSLVTWQVIESAHFAVLDERFQIAMSPYPAVVAALFGRLARRCRLQAQRLAISQQPRISARLHFLFWQLADRFGRVEKDGFVVPLRLSHSVLAELVSAQRPSVTLGLQELDRGGLVKRRRAGDWLLPGHAPDAVAGIAPPRAPVGV